jgi:hypothetical protein
MSRDQAALATRNAKGCAVLHVACFRSLDQGVIHRIMQIDSASLQAVNIKGHTARHEACKSTLPDDTLLDMATRWPVSCIFAAKNGRPLPYDRLDASTRPIAIIDVIGSTTNKASCAMLECLLFGVRSTTPSVVIDHLEQALVSSIPGLSLIRFVTVTPAVLLS